MSRHHHILLFIVMFVFIFLNQTIETKAQVSEGGVPPSFRYETTLRSKLAAHDVPVTFHVPDMKQVDDWQVREGISLPCVAALIDVSLNTTNAGQWSQLPNGETIWQLNLYAKDALALMLYYTDFYIPEGGKLFIYNAAKTQLLGAYTHRTNPTGGRFATEFVAGDDLTLEYVASPDGEQPRIEIEAIGYGYNHLSVTRNSVSLRRTAAYCEVDVNCEEGDAWQSQKKGVCHMTQRIGGRTYLCSGSLMNNTAQDLKPYILSATHCEVDENNLKATPEEMQQWVFYFHMEYEGCRDNSRLVTPRTKVGCKKVASTATSGGSDGLLLLINTPIPANYDVYYNGWDRRDRPAQSGTSIHHPQGDQKKISTFKKPATHATVSLTSGISGDLNGHWDVTFAATANGHGITDKGSSGSPLFNENKLVVGTLTAGNSSCSRPEGYNFYGKMGYHWDKYKQADSTRMDRWLDPLHSGVEILEGRYHDMAYIHPPFNLQASYQPNNTVLLTWGKPASGTPAKYNIYNNNVKIGETTALSYTDEHPQAGTRVYSVSSVYTSGNESNFVHTEVLVNEFKAPVNIAVAYTLQQKVAVVWDPPVYEQTIYWGESKSMYQVTMDEGTPFYFGQRWGRNEILDLHKKKIKAVQFVPIRNNTYEVYIAQGEDRVYTQTITNPAYSKTNTIELNTPFVIDGTKELIVAFYVSQHSQSGRDSEYPAVCDGGPAVNEKGNIYSYDGKTWKTLNSEVDNPEDFDYNFFVAAIVSSEEGDIPPSNRSAQEYTEPSVLNSLNLRSATMLFSADPIELYSLRPAPFPEVTGYTIYRDGKKLETVNTSPRRYVDDEPDKTVYYQVAAMFEHQYEGVLSDSASISPMSIESIESVESGKAKLYPVVFSSQVEIQGFYQATRVDVYDAQGRLCLRVNNPDNVINTQSLRSGIYYFRIYVKSGDDIVLRGIKR